MELPYDKDFYKDYGIFIKPIDYPMSTNKLDALIEIARMQKFFQCNPVKWIDLMYNIELLDAQALMIERSWNCPETLCVCSRGFGKSTCIDLELMAKDSLFTNVWTYIASGNSRQAETTFLTLEKLANDSIDTFSGSTGKIFKDEVMINNASGDGFSHNPNGFTFQTYCGSGIKTLTANIDGSRGSRGSVVFDECGFLSEEMINVYGAFAIVNNSLRTGKDSSGKSIDPIRQRTFATNIPNQKFYISSASSTDTKFYKLYRDFAKKQIMGDPNYCVLHIDCEICFKPTIRGELIAPLLSRSIVDAEMRTNPEKARREYYCQFTTEAGTDAIIRRGVITRNEEVRKPILYNETGKQKFIIAYDPARQRDNSVVQVWEVYEVENKDGSIDLRAKIAAVFNLLDIGKKIKSPMQTPDQINYLRKLILDYNGGADNYDNILGIYIDAGAGGGGVMIADMLMQDWTDESGMTHRGLIDKEYSSDYVSKFPNAVNKLHLISPTAYKSIIFEAGIELINQDKVGFTATYDGKGYLTVFDVDEKVMNKAKNEITEKLKKQKLSDEEIKIRLQEELNNIESVKTKIIKLDWREELALQNIDALKEEVVNMVRKKRDSGKDGFDLSPEKANKLNDDRCYTMMLCAYGLMEERRKLIYQKPKIEPKSIMNNLPIRKGVRRSTF